VTRVRPGWGTEILSLERRIRKLYVRSRIRITGEVEAYEKWRDSFLYTQNAYGTLHISELNPDMYGSGTEYLYGTERDFFYLTRFTPPPV
jgi:hypothetical protein